MQNAENNTIDTNKALSTLPKFKQIEEKDDKNRENNHSLIENPEKMQDSSRNTKENTEKKTKEPKKKLNKQTVIAGNLKKPQRFPGFEGNGDENAKISRLFPYNPDKISFNSPWAPENQPNLLNFPTYSQLLNFYLRKKAETPIFPSHYDFY